MFCLSQIKVITEIKRRDHLAGFLRDITESYATVPVISCSHSKENTVFKCVKTLVLLGREKSHYNTNCSLPNGASAGC